MVLDQFSDHKYDEWQYRVTGTSACVLIYNPETILRVEEQSLESKLDGLLAAHRFEEAVLKSQSAKPSL